MKKFRAAYIALVAVMAAFVVTPNKLMAETFKKLHSSPQLIISYTAGGFNDTNEPTSSTVDLAGGDTDKCSFAVYVASSSGNSLLTFTIQTSPDGGTTWIPTGDTIVVSTGATSTTSSTAYAANKAVNPGTKVRLTSSLATSTSYYSMKVWAMPSVD